MIGQDVEQGRETLSVPVQMESEFDVFNQNVGLWLLTDRFSVVKGVRRPPSPAMPREFFRE
jgi:hypothetical protein